jgi:hypothetical protein
MLSRQGRQRRLREARITSDKLLLPAGANPRIRSARERTSPLNRGYTRRLERLGREEHGERAGDGREGPAEASAMAPVPR